MLVAVNRRDTKFNPDPSRVIARFHFAGEERSKEIIRKVFDMREEDAKIALSQVLRGYSKRHRSISKIFENRLKIA